MHKADTKKKKFFNMKIVWWVLFVLWISGVILLSTIRGDMIPKLPIPNRIFGIGMDKIFHFGLFTTGGILLSGALRISFAWRWRTILLVTIICLSLFGMSDEFHQLYTPKRSGADIGDWLADTLGSTFGAFLLYFFYGFPFIRKRRIPDCLAPEGD